MTFKLFKLSEIKENIFHISEVISNFKNLENLKIVSLVIADAQIISFFRNYIFNCRKQTFRCDQIGSK